MAPIKRRAREPSNGSATSAATTSTAVSKSSNERPPRKLRRNLAQEADEEAPTDEELKKQLDALSGFIARPPSPVAASTQIGLEEAADTWLSYASSPRLDFTPAQRTLTIGAPLPAVEVLWHFYSLCARRGDSSVNGMVPGSGWTYRDTLGFNKRFVSMWERRTGVEVEKEQGTQFSNFIIRMACEDKFI
ncbi:hypothetical protein CALVIDRAFT_595252 [Calocera viscosa TUFC12733]|uniref:Uncharacterized protein n=1 Tax=Calocera viscosa (strain TUFC12733) TaxID=1330018 RepID=A0A167R0Q1_CALVF|nr:hypothetical protein CALVIDRAFT_595252 [Calocera viscosa TUFC12733]